MLFALSFRAHFAYSRSCNVYFLSYAYNSICITMIVCIQPNLCIDLYAHIRCKVVQRQLRKGAQALNTKFKFERQTSIAKIYYISKL
jgi:hypothetical protein